MVKLSLFYVDTVSNEDRYAALETCSDLIVNAVVKEGCGCISLLSNILVVYLIEVFLDSYREYFGYLTSK